MQAQGAGKTPVLKQTSSMRAIPERMEMSDSRGSGYDAEKLRREVRRGYAAIARSGGSCCSSSSCCGSTDAGTAMESLGYRREDLAVLPDGANMGLSCGNPLALASLKPGEVVLDLGSGGGMDVFLAARSIGPAGRAIGVDMTAEMVSKARAAMETFRAASGLDNVEFRLGEIENLPVADASVDVVISNCVINLSTDKPRVWREIARVLKPGGRAVVSDPALLRPLPDSLRMSLEAYVGCVAGAVTVEETRDAATAAGLNVTDLRLNSSYSLLLESLADQLPGGITDMLPESTGPSDFVVGLDITAVKPE
ncbi:arsenite methyltransferase [Candidatus Fermentibacteria bacterium]|nr:arsenite methyltransferase [Candidatus Fermentibacteria bacterium]